MGRYAKEPADLLKLKAALLDELGVRRVNRECLKFGAVAEDRGAVEILFAGGVTLPHLEEVVGLFLAKGLVGREEPARDRILIEEASRVFLSREPERDRLIGDPERIDAAEGGPAPIGHMDD